MPAGRPTLLTPELQQEINSYLNTGVTIETACAACGIEPRTYRAWLKRGRDEQNRLDADPKARLRKAEEPYLNFLHETTRTLARVETRLLGGINQSAGGYDVERVTEVYERGEDGQMRLVDRKVNRERVKDWRAAAWLLERRWGATYGAQQKITVQSRDPESMTDEELDAYIAELEAQRGRS